MQIKTQILLTGAGFSCNAGGLSGQQIRTILFNNSQIKANEQIAEVVKSQGADYESIYRRIIEESAFGKEEEKIIADAYQEAYENLDRSICAAFSTPYQHPLNLNKLSTFLQWFAGEEGSKERGHIFTLNQDVFIERGFHGDVNMGVPGIVNWRIRRHWVPLADWEKNGHGNPPIHVVPDQEACDRFMESDRLGLEVPQRLQYIKLHGSMNWRKEEGSPVMVIAGSKREQIRSIPLLNWYLKKFQDVISNHDIHLCLVGYGFGDPHINGLLAEAIDEKQLVLSIVYPGTWEQIDHNLRERGKRLEKEGEVDFSDTLIRGLSRGKIFDFNLQQAFPAAGNIGETYEARQLRETFGPS